MKLIHAVSEIDGMEPQDLQRQLETLHPSSFGWALSCCKWNKEEAEEVLQTAYLKIYEGKAKFMEKSTFKTWLFGLIRITAAESRRRNFLRSMFLSSCSEEISKHHDAPPFLQSLVKSEQTNRLIDLLKGLPVRQREVLQLVFYQDMTIQEAAYVMEVSLGTARTHYERGKKQLREKLVAGGEFK